MEDGQIQLAAATVAELGDAAATRLRKISLVLLLVTGGLTLGCLAIIAAHPAALLNFMRVLPTILAFGGLSIERMLKANVAKRAARLAAGNPQSPWVLDGHRILSLPPSPPYMFRVSKQMRRTLTAMPRATLLLK